MRLTVARSSRAAAGDEGLAEIREQKPPLASSGSAGGEPKGLGAGSPPDVINLAGFSGVRKRSGAELLLRGRLEHVLHELVRRFGREVLAGQKDLALGIL